LVGVRPVAVVETYSRLDYVEQCDVTLIALQLYQLDYDRV
jgi:hypothetical protein